MPAAYLHGIVKINTDRWHIKSAAGLWAPLRLHFMVISDYAFCCLLDRDLNCHCLSQLVVVAVACRSHVYHDLVGALLQALLYSDIAVLGNCDVLVA